MNLPRALKPQAATLVGAALALLASATALGKSSDRNQPMTIDSGASECSQGGNMQCVFTGNVEIVQGSLRINAARAEMRRKLNETQDSLRKDEPAPEEKKSARTVQVGDVVQLRSMGVKATVLAISSDRTLTLQAGILRVTAREDEVLLLENEKPAVTVRTESRGTALRQSAVSSELDIRGMETIEAIPVVERYIDSAVQSRLETVTIIHGKGTGALRAAVQQSLRRNKQVKSFRLGRYGEGETGVTVVELK